MPKFEVTVMVEYCGEVEAENAEAAEAMGWDWEDNLNYFAVDSIEVAELEDDEEDEDEEE
jgi:hypothetical protein